MSEQRGLPKRAILRNALTWGAAWAVVGGLITGTLGLFDPNPGIESLPERVGLAVAGGIGWGVRFGIAGAVIGALFSTAMGLAWRGRRIRDIDPARFALLGALVGGAGVPLYLQAMNLLTGGSLLAWNLVATDAVIGIFLGGAVAGGSILLARRIDGQDPEAGQLTASEAPALPEGKPAASEFLERERAARR